MHMLGVKTENRIKEMAVFWVTGPIKYASLEYGLYKSWNVKVDDEIKVLDEIINFFKTKCIFGKDWVRNNDVCISMLSTKDHVRD